MDRTLQDSAFKSVYKQLHLQKIVKVILVSIIMVFAYQNADASHFRYSSIMWVRDANTNKVNFTVTYAFRYAYGSDGFTYFFGDGSSIYLSTNDPTVATKIGESLVNNNPNDNNSIVIYKFTFSHTYAATGPYTSYFSSC